MTPRISIIASLLLFAACTAGSGSDDAQRGPLGKADSVGSCITSDCDGPAPGGGNCWCDEACTEFGDCCPDKVEVCDAPVSQSCGGLAGLGCGEDEYCHYDEDETCGAADQGGTCLLVPEACTFELLEVCGCDGNTYSNSCFAAMAGVSVLHQTACEEPNGGADQCGGFAGLSCGEDEFCDYDLDEMCGAADHLGTCRPVPEVCTADFDPVCGCDNHTYSNACQANAAGQSVFSAGACEEPAQVTCGGFGNLQCPSGTVCVDDPNDGCDEDNGGADCGGICVAN
jgi:hypothetical protein